MNTSASASVVVVVDTLQVPVDLIRSYLERNFYVGKLLSKVSVAEGQIIVKSIIQSDVNICAYNLQDLVTYNISIQDLDLLESFFKNELRRAERTRFYLINERDLKAMNELQQQSFNRIVQMFLQYHQLFINVQIEQDLYEAAKSLEYVEIMAALLRDYPGSIFFLGSGDKQSLRLALRRNCLNLVCYSLREFRFSAKFLGEVLHDINRNNKYQHVSDEIVSMIRVYFQQHAGRANQTAHDRLTESSISESIARLKNRYQTPPSILKRISSFFDNSSVKSPVVMMSTEAMRVKLMEIRVFLSEIEYQHAERFLDRLDRKDGIAYPWESGQQSQTYTLLHLVHCALSDRKHLSSMQGHVLTDAEHLQVWCSWFKSAIVDSQVAYALDKGKGVPSTVDSKEMSCESGSDNRLIAALHLIHPDVQVQEGNGTMKNKEQWKEYRNQQAIHEFCRNIPTYIAKLLSGNPLLTPPECHHCIIVEFEAILERHLPGTQEELDNCTTITSVDRNLTEILLSTLELIDADFITEIKQSILI